jgi:thymidine kinase
MFSISDTKKNGVIDVITGCMYSGKTSETINKINKYKLLGKKILILNHSLDKSRYKDNSLSTHSNINIPCINVSNFDEIKTDPSFDYINSDVIVIEEAQFFKTGLCDFVLEAADKDNKIVIVTGLDGDSDRKEFGEINRLLPHSTSFVKLHALCLKCNDGTLACFTKCLVNKTDQILVGSDTFIPVCRYHYNNN